MVKNSTLFYKYVKVTSDRFLMHPLLLGAFKCPVDLIEPYRTYIDCIINK